MKTENVTVTIIISNNLFTIWCGLPQMYNLFYFPIKIKFSASLQLFLRLEVRKSGNKKFHEFEFHPKIRCGFIRRTRQTDH